MCVILFITVKFHQQPAAIQEQVLLVWYFVKPLIISVWRVPFGLDSWWMETVTSIVKSQLPAYTYVVSNELINN